jgi:D-psicose/D-tagatose/L-ribulose 3-epimerase
VTHEALLAGLAAAGAQGVEPFHRDFVEDPALLPRYRKSLADNGLKAAAIDVMCNLVYADAAQKQQGRDELRRGLDICRELDADIAHVAGHRLVPGVTPADGRRMIADGLVEVADVARAHDMVLAIEDFNPSPDLICSASDCLEVMRLSGGVVKLVFDTGNFIAVNERADEQFDVLAEYICHCHFKDFTTDGGKGCRGCDLGTGEIPNATVAGKLKARGYDGWIALETRGRDDLDPVSAVRKELPLLKSWFGQ